MPASFTPVRARESKENGAHLAPPSVPVCHTRFNGRERDTARFARVINTGSDAEPCKITRIETGESAKCGNAATVEISHTPPECKIITLGNTRINKSTG